MVSVCIILRGVFAFISFLFFFNFGVFLVECLSHSQLLDINERKLQPNTALYSSLAVNNHLINPVHLHVLNNCQLL